MAALTAAEYSDGMSISAYPKPVRCGIILFNILVHKIEECREEKP